MISDRLSEDEPPQMKMPSSFRQYIAGYTVTNFLLYPISRHVTKASALEFLFYEPHRRLMIDCYIVKFR